MGVTTDSGELPRIREKLRALGKATHAFAAATDDYGLLLDTIAGCLSDVIGDACALFTLSDDGATLSLATLRSPHADFVRECRAVLAAPMKLAARPAWQRVLVTGEPLLVPRIGLEAYAADSAPEYVQLLETTALRTTASSSRFAFTTPESLGLLALSRFQETSRPYDGADQELAQVIADHAALAIGSARAYAAERAARAAERASGTANVEADAREARLAALVDASDDAIIGKTLEGTVTSWNRGAENIFGYSASEIVGQSIRALVPPDRQGEESEILERLAHGEVRRFETVRRRKDGRDIDVSVTTPPLRDDSGRVTGVSKVARDITHRRRAEGSPRFARCSRPSRGQGRPPRRRNLELEQRRKQPISGSLALFPPSPPVEESVETLRTSEERLRTVTDVARVGLVVVGADHRYRYANRSYAEILHLPSADIVEPCPSPTSFPRSTRVRFVRRLDRALAGERLTYEASWSPPPRERPRRAATRCPTSPAPNATSRSSSS